MSDLVGNPEDLFSHNKAHILLVSQTKTGVGAVYEKYCICKNKRADQLCGNRAADQCPLFTLQTLYFLNLKPLVIICGCTDRFMSDLVGNPRDRFSHDPAHM